MKRGLKEEHSSEFVRSPMGSCSLCPDEKGTESWVIRCPDEKGTESPLDHEKLQTTSYAQVAAYAPMKRGLKADLRVAAYAPMKRGLKDNAKRKLQPMPR